jgi:hypothetical protein
VEPGTDHRSIRECHDEAARHPSRDRFRLPSHHFRLRGARASPSAVFPDRDSSRLFHWEPLIHGRLRPEMIPRQSGHPKNLDHLSRRVHASLLEVGPDDPTRWFRRSHGPFHVVISRLDQPGRRRGHRRSTPRRSNRLLRSIAKTMTAENENQMVLTCDHRNSARRLLAIPTL